MKTVRGMHVVVIGAGFGGLAAAAHLARAGATVTILEKADTVGGKAAFLAKDGFIFDAGPTLFTMPELAADTFAAAGILNEEVSQLARLDSVCRCVFASGKELVASADSNATRASIARISGQDASSWDAFMAECRKKSGSARVSHISRHPLTAFWDSLDVSSNADGRR